MKSKKDKNIIFWEGFESTFDLYGLGFNRNYRISHINESWHNVGDFFTKAFDEYKSLNKEGKMKSDKKSPERKLHSH